MTHTKRQVIVDRHQPAIEQAIKSCREAYPIRRIGATAFVL
ncbi:MAG: hypothetical protein WC058_04615 [Phycisphaeraceae bacterium]